MRKIIDKIEKFLLSPTIRFGYLNELGFYKNLTDSEFLKRSFKLILGYELDLDNPKSFNEKLQWLKLYDRCGEYTKLVDKSAVKKYVADLIGEEYIIPTIGVWERFEDINIEELPNKFVMKCTHDSGSVIVCRNKGEFDAKKAKKMINKRLGKNYFYKWREWPYKNVKPQIIVEEYMGEENEEGLQDYKFMCFNGKVKCSFVCSERFSDQGLHVTFFDRDWNVLPFERHYPANKEGIPRPLAYEEMLCLAERLAEGIPFVRVDFYDIKGKIYFGELTFYPGSGIEEFSPIEWDYELGNWIDLSVVDKK